MAVEHRRAETRGSGSTIAVGYVPVSRLTFSRIRSYEVCMTNPNALPSADKALNTDAYFRLYQGALKIKNPSARLAACYIILLAGRLGFRLQEIQHLREEWIDWRRGEIKIPRNEICTCAMAYCEKTSDPGSQCRYLPHRTKLLQESSSGPVRAREPSGFRRVTIDSAKAVCTQMEYVRHRGYLAGKTQNRG